MPAVTLRASPAGADRRAAVTTSLLPGAQVLIGGELQEHRLQVGLDGGQLGDVQALLGQQPGDDGKVEPLVGSG